MDLGWFLLGSELEAFESEYAKSVGSAHCVGVSNGLEAHCSGWRRAGLKSGETMDKCQKTMNPPREHKLGRASVLEPE